MKKKISCILLLTTIVAFACYLFSNTIYGKILLWGISLNISGYQITGFQNLNNVTPLKIQFLEAKNNDGTFLRLQEVEAEDHAKYIQDQKFLLKSLFEPTTSPYPEVITNIIECPDEFKPKETPVSNGTIYTLFAGERLNFGICTKDLIKYRAVHAIFDCLQKGIFELSLFGQSEQNLSSTAKSFSCNQFI